MLVPRNQGSQPGKNTPTITEEPTVYDNDQSEAPSKPVSQPEDEWLSLEAGDVSDTKTPVNSMLSAPTPTNSNAPPPKLIPPQNIPPLCRATMTDHPLLPLRRLCNLATRQFLFEKAENILPFRLNFPQDYPQEVGYRGQNSIKRLQIQLNWVRNALTKNVLGEF